MIKTAEREYIETYANIPEHIPKYVTAISQTEPFLFGDYMVHMKKGHLIFVGYPLKEEFNEEEMERSLEDAIHHFKPREVALISPIIPSHMKKFHRPPSDHYYRLDLSLLSISQKLRNMLTRASRELSIERVRIFGKKHKRMVDEFVKTHPVDKATQFIFEKIHKYIISSEASWVFDVKNKKGELVAFDIAEFGAKQYAFYMFNFRSKGRYVPGASDLLLSEVIEQAKKENKRYINLGLGIDKGVTFFKKKWGGVPFFPYHFCLYTSSKASALDTLLQKL